MVTGSESEDKNQSAKIPPFHQRFSLSINREEAERRFINRIINKFEQDLNSFFEFRGIDPYKMALYNVATKLGKEYNYSRGLRVDLREGFYDCLQALEAIYEILAVQQGFEATKLNDLINFCLSISEIDLGVTWRDGLFWPSGAKLLDEALVNENLKWISNLHLDQILVPFEKGLKHFLEAQKQPEKLADTVTDMYESLEAMANITCDNDRDLSANREQFINKLVLSNYYKKMLHEFIEYANQYRHAMKPGEKREPPKRNEVEAFFYTTGLFIRLAIQQSQSPYPPSLNP